MGAMSGTRGEHISAQLSTKAPAFFVERGVQPCARKAAKKRILSTVQQHFKHGWQRTDLRTLAAADVESLDKLELATPAGQPEDAVLSRPPVIEQNGTAPEAERRSQNDATTSGQESAERHSHPRHKHHRRGSSHRRQHNKGSKRGAVTDFPYKVGDTVVGKIVGGQNGWRIALEYDPEVLGFCLPIDLPHLLRDSVHQPVWSNTKFGLRREFRIKAIPPDLEYNGKGPLLSARQTDLDVIWKRAAQIMEICKEDNEVITMAINSKNSGGILGSFEGLACFVPYSFIPRTRADRDSKEGWLQSVGESYVGKNVEVSICDMDRRNNRFVGNMLKADQLRSFNRLKVGDLVWGEVQGIESYGVFVTLDDYPAVRGLLHIKAVSRNHVDDLQALFHRGEKVRCLVLNLDPETQRISLSTSEIEAESGDMLFNKAQVYENAEESAADFRQWVQQRERDVESEEASFDNADQGLAWDA